MRIETREITLEPARFVFISSLVNRRTLLRTQVVFGIMIAIYVGVAAGFGGTRQIGMILVIAALMLGFTLYLPVRVRAQAQRAALDPANARFFRPYTLRLENERLSVLRAGQEEGHYPWGEILAKHTMSDGAVLYLSRRQFLWLPWGSLSDADRAEMERRISELPVLDAVPNRTVKPSNG